MENTIVDEKVSAEDRSALIERIIRQYADMIYRIAYQHTGSHADAEDILQEVSISLVTKNAPLHDEDYLKRWLVRVTVNRCHDLYRHNKRIQTEALEDHLETPAEPPNEVMEELYRLPELYRNILYLYYYESFTLKDIAGVLHKSINTVSSGLQRARKQLKKILTEEGFDHDEKSIYRNDQSHQGTKSIR